MRHAVATVATAIALVSGGVFAPAAATSEGDPRQGFALVDAAGGISAHGDQEQLQGVPAGLSTDGVVGAALTPDGRGAWVATADGHVLTSGDAESHGSMASRALNAPIVGIAATPTGNGYWLVALDGGVFAFGDAAFRGSTGNLVLNEPVVNIAPTTDGNGYWLVALDGGVFAFGDARFQGSMGATHLNGPIGSIVAMADGYLLVAIDGGIFAFGDAAFHGSLGGTAIADPVAAAVPTESGHGYWLVTVAGQTFAFGDAADIEGRVDDGAPIVALATPWASSSAGGLATLGLIPAGRGGAVTAVGDSILWVSTDELLAALPDTPITIDGVIGRTFGEGLEVLRILAARGAVESTLLVHLGTNGGFTDAQLDELLTLAGPRRRVLLVNVRIDRAYAPGVNARLAAAAASRRNVELVDWYAASAGHPEMFIADGYHPSDEGIEVYVQLLVDAIRN